MPTPAPLVLPADGTIVLVEAAGAVVGFDDFVGALVGAVGATAGVVVVFLLHGHHPDDEVGAAFPVCTIAGVGVGTVCCAIADMAATPVSKLRAKIIFFMLSSIKFIC